MTKRTAFESAKVVAVVFRKWRDKSGGILALFPEIAVDMEGYYCESFEHMGQHGGADYRGCIARTVPAKPEEYADLKRELESYPYEYRLRVIRRAPTDLVQRRLAFTFSEGGRGDNRGK